jgi:glutathione-regulated potassium-efflux system protein KefB
MDLGAHVVRELFHSSLKLGEKLLVDLGVPGDLAAEHTRRFREHDERLLRAQHLVRDDEDALVQSVKDARLELEELFSADVGEGMLGVVSAEEAEEE